MFALGNFTVEGDDFEDLERMEFGQQDDIGLDLYLQEGEDLNELLGSALTKASFHNQVCFTS